VNQLLPAVIGWASSCQREIAEKRGPFVISVTLGKPTDSRVVIVRVEQFEIEPSGWVSDKLLQIGELIVWEKGYADAQWFDADAVASEGRKPSLNMHWDDVDPGRLDGTFACFTDKFRGITA
jgi:hypothetical protein